MLSWSTGGRVHTSSTLDMSRGLMYSKPSNSVWSIVDNTSLQGREEGREGKSGGESKKEERNE